VLRGCLRPPVVDAVYRDYASRYGALDAREMSAQASGAAESIHCAWQ